MGNLLRSVHLVVNNEQTDRILSKCVRKGTMGRITPSKLTGRTSEFCGDVIGVEAVYHFVGTRTGIGGKQFQALLIADCLSRYSICSIIKDFRAVTHTPALMNDWIRPLGKHKRTISDNGPPEMTGRGWGSCHALLASI